MAKKLQKYKRKEAVVYVLPRGGVVLGYEVAKELGLPLDLVIIRKIGHPLMKEYAICAVAEDEELVCNEAERLLIDKKWLESATHLFEEPGKLGIVATLAAQWFKKHLPEQSQYYK